jgi:hypothetical protein
VVPLRVPVLAGRGVPISVARDGLVPVVEEIERAARRVLQRAQALGPRVDSRARLEAMDSSSV